MKARKQRWNNNFLAMNKKAIKYFSFAALAILSLCLIDCGSTLTPPTSYNAPTNLNIEKLNEGKIKITWQYNITTSDTLVFIIAKKEGKDSWIEYYGETSNKLHSFIDDIPTNDSLAYAYKVQVHNLSSQEYSAFSEVVAYLSAQTVPTDLAILQTSQEELQLSWKDNCVGEDGYIIDKKLADGSWNNGYRKTIANVTTFSDSTNLFEIVHYRVSAFVGNSKSTPSKENSIFPTLLAPTKLTLQKPDPSKIKIMWEDNSDGEEGFYIDKKIGSLDWVTKYDSVDSNATSWIDDIELPCGTFYYRIRAFEGEFYSAYSNEEHTNVQLNLIGSLDTPGDATKIFIPNWNAFVADQYDGLVIIDCSTPNSPEQIGTSLNFPDRTLSVFTNGNFAYVTSHSGSDDPQEPGEISIVDISNLESPFISGRCPTAGIPKDIFVSGDYAFVADGENGLSILYIATSTPDYVSNCSTGGDARKVFIKDNYAFIANGLNGLTIIEIPNYDYHNPTFVSNFPTDGLTQDVYVLGNYAYVADGEEGLQIIDVSEPENPDKVGYCKTDSCFAYSVFARDNYVFLADKNNGLIVIDVSNPLAPYILGTFEMATEPVSIYLSGSYAFLADNEGLKIVQIAP